MWVRRHTVDREVQCKLCEVVVVIYLSKEPKAGVRIKEEAAGENEDQL